MSPQSCNYNNLYICKVNTIIPYQVNTNFWGSPDNNYGFGSSNISDAISRHPAMHTTPMPVEQTSNLPEINAFNDSYGGYAGNNVLGSDQQITMPNSQKSTVWDKFKKLGRKYR